MELAESRKKLLELQSKISAFEHAMGSIFYDGVTAAPKETAGNRAHTLSILSEEVYKLTTGEDTVSLLEFLDENKESLTEEEKRMVFLMLKDIRKMQKIPINEYVEYERLLVEADDVWHRAKENNDFALFEPVLTSIFETVKRFAFYCDPQKHPYDYWLNEYETGLNMQVCDEFFEKLRSRIVPLIHRIQERPQVDASCLKGFFPVYKQEKLSEILMKTIGLDSGHCVLGTTEHPFTTSLGSHLDERITTHYSADNFASSMFSVIHEGGHALYDTGSPERYAYTVLDGGVSMGIHESQSRFYENIIGRSREFAHFIFPKIKTIFPQLSDYSSDEFYKAINLVEPSLIRTEADEVTYCLHVMIRYELEKAILSGTLTVHELPNAWNRLYKDYLGVDVPNNREGVLQDSHWSGGSIGYFPSYALGSAYGAQLFYYMNQEFNVAECIAAGNFEPINSWNKEHIWKYGSLIPPAELLKNIFGCPFNPDFYLDYLENKYNEIYQL